QAPQDSAPQPKRTPVSPRRSRRTCSRVSPSPALVTTGCPFTVSATSRSIAILRRSETSGHEKSAVHVERHAREIGRLVGCDEGRRIGDLLRRSEPPQGN